MAASTTNECSNVSVSRNPTIELDSASFFGPYHAPTDKHFSCLVVEHDHHEEGKGGYGKVRAGNLSGSQHSVTEGHVKKENDKSSFEEETKVSMMVNHTLLRDAQISGLTDQEHGPLDGHN